MPIKLCTVLGTRPEIIRLSRIIPKLDKFCDHILVHTGQNFDYNMSQVFFDELGIREADYFLGVKSQSFGEQVGKIFTASERVMVAEKPDRLLVLGDTNSALSAFVAKRLGIPVYHLEAGNRCFDNKVPEEVNRRVIDHSSDYHLPYTERSRANLLREGIASDGIFVVGNPIFEVMGNYHKRSGIQKELGLTPHSYFLVTAHRQENVDDKERLRNLVYACATIGDKYGMPVIFSRHPRTAERIKGWDIGSSAIVFHEPFGFTDFLTLEQDAYCVLTDCVHPDTLVMTDVGIIMPIKDIVIGAKVIGQNIETVNTMGYKKHDYIIHIKSRLCDIVVSPNHRLCIWRDNKILTSPADEVTAYDKLVTFAKVSPAGKSLVLIPVRNEEYVRLSKVGKQLLRKHSLGHNLRQFGRVKSNVFYGQKGISQTRLTTVLNYLGLTTEEFEQYVMRGRHTPRAKHISLPKNLTPALAEVVGYACGDGSWYSSRLGFYDEHREVLEHINVLSESIFGITGTIKRDPRERCFILTVYSTVLATFMIRNFESEFKHCGVSQSMQMSTNEIVAAFLRGLFEAEGCVYDHSIGISMVNKQVVQIVKYLLLRFGIISNLYTHIGKRTKDKNPMNILHIYDRTSQEAFSEYIGFISKKKRGKLLSLINRPSLKNKRIPRHGDFVEDEVVKVERMSNKSPLIDISVSPSQTFWANGVLSHNSGTVQEECCILKIPCVTLRDNTERPETIECGGNILSGVMADDVLRCVKIVTGQKPDWTPPGEYLVPNVSEKVINIVLGAK